MRPAQVIVDTNVVVAGLITASSTGPTARILDAMLDGTLAYILSPALLQEYRTVLLRAKPRRLHHLAENEIDRLLTEIVANGIWQETVGSGPHAPDPGDDHLWALLAQNTSATLITGDRLLQDSALPGHRILPPAEFCAARKQDCRQAP